MPPAGLLLVLFLIEEDGYFRNALSLSETHFPFVCLGERRAWCWSLSLGIVL